MHDLDEARQARKAADRTIRIGGEEFLVRSSVRPEVLLDWESLPDDAPPVEGLAVVDALICQVLEPTEMDPDPAGRWVALRARQDDALTTGDIMRVVRTATAIVAGRPTVVPSPSTAGAESTEPSSTATSPLAVAT